MMSRHYLLDLMRVTPRDSNFTGPGSRFCILRPELVTAFVQVFPIFFRSILIIFPALISCTFLFDQRLKLQKRQTLKLLKKCQ